MTIRAKVATAICLAICLVARPNRGVAADEPASAKEPGDLRDTILLLDDQFWAAASRHDVDALARLFAGDYYGIGNDGTRWAKATILEQHRMARLGDLSRTSAREVIRVGEGAVLLAYDARFKVFTKAGVLRDTAHQRLVSCWVQRDGGWFVRFSQATDLAGPTTHSPTSDHRADRQAAKPEGEAPKDGKDDGKRGTSKTTVVSLRNVIVDEMDAGQNTITLMIGWKEPPGEKAKAIGDQEGKVATGERRVATRLVNLPVSKDAEIRISSRQFPSVANNLPRGLSELHAGMPASVELTISGDEVLPPVVVSKVVGWREP
jgi:hypothetical protein